MKRTTAAVLATVGAVAIAANHAAYVFDDSFYVALLVLGPFMAAIGVGGLVDPRLLAAIGRHGKDLPLRFRIAGHLLALAGLASSAALFFFVYRPPAAGG